MELKKQVRESVEVHEAVGGRLEKIEEMARTVVGTFQSDNHVFLFGNGGSAADAQHWAAELSGRFYRDRPSLPAIALTTNTSALTAIANDEGYERVFVRQLAGQAEAGDMAIGISTSGTSTNVVRALRYAQENGITTAGFTGAGGGDMKEFCEHVIEIPSTDVARVQEGHLLCGHLLCGLVEETLFGEENIDQ
jgi:D-sedoheptulose 7-phosphate isomerase